MTALRRPHPWPTTSSRPERRFADVISKPTLRRRVLSRSKATSLALGKTSTASYRARHGLGYAMVAEIIADIVRIVIAVVDVVDIDDA